MKMNLSINKKSGRIKFITTQQKMNGIVVYRSYDGEYINPNDVEIINSIPIKLKRYFLFFTNPFCKEKFPKILYPSNYNKIWNLNSEENIQMKSEIKKRVKEYKENWLKTHRS